ncbi:MAG: carbon monoxide dehydrogenase [Deltaproteobacteria bacterium]|nr:MAG: carbon monoxide dehydrogenase [Deltaproteobacteria bacterium]
MSYTIALGGKGGTGKTTIAGFLIRYMIEKGKTPILAVDADSNSNLHEVLGVEVETTLGEAREMMKKDVPTGMTKDIFMEIQVEKALVESDGFDLIAMGRPEGPGCYCAANNILTELIQRLMKNYPYLVVDNEAGMEHFSRLTQKNIDLLLLVSDPSRRGLTAAKRILELVDSLPIRVADRFLIINQAHDENLKVPDDIIEIFGKDNWGVIPADPKVAEFDMQGKPTFSLPEDSIAIQKSFSLFDKILSNTT